MKHNKKGFTLIEIIVTLVIMGILLAIAVPSILGYVKKAEDMKYMSVARSINVETSTYINQYILTHPEEAKNSVNFNNIILKHFVEEFSYYRTATGGSFEERFPDYKFPSNYEIYSVDVEFDGKSAVKGRNPRDGWQFDTTKKNHAITKISIWLKEPDKNVIDGKVIVTMLNDKMYIYSGREEIDAALSAKEPFKEAPILFAGVVTMSK